MMRRFHLYPDTAEQQRLGASLSLAHIHELDGFTEAIAPFGVAIERVAPEHQILDKWREYTVRPPLPKEKIKGFGEALVWFAESYGLDYHDGVLFIDHTNPVEEELRQAMIRKVGPPREQDEVL